MLIKYQHLEICTEREVQLNIIKYNPYMKTTRVKQEGDFLNSADSCEIHLINELPCVGSPVLKASHVI